jgi:hypothetical protein
VIKGRDGGKALIVRLSARTGVSSAGLSNDFPVATIGSEGDLVQHRTEYVA